MTKDEWTVTDIPKQSGRVAVVTGANSGVGFEIATALANRGAHVVLAVRDLDKGKDAAARIIGKNPRADISLQRLELASLDSIRVAADEMRSEYPAIDLLINNAGVSWTPKSKTAGGFEMQFGTNHLGHFALTGMLLDRLLQVPGSRIVTMSSLVHRMGARIQFADLHSSAGTAAKAVCAAEAGQPPVHL